MVDDKRQAAGFYITVRCLSVYTIDNRPSGTNFDSLRGVV